jgi:hypothetical protein
MCELVDENFKENIKNTLLSRLLNMFMFTKNKFLKVNFKQNCLGYAVQIKRK